VSICGICGVFCQVFPEKHDICLFPIVKEPKHTFLQSAVFPMLFTLAMWVVFYCDNHYLLNLNQYGIWPRKAAGLLGILASPLLHGDLSHIVSNTVPVLLLSTLLFYHYRETAFKVFFLSWLGGNLLTWLFARVGSPHIGASSIIYALAGFLFFSGIIRRNKMLFGVSLLITFLYGTIVWGVLPTEFLQAIHYVTERTNISWEGHLFGFISGVSLAFIYRDVGIQEPTYSWEENNDEDVDESDPYWMVDENNEPLTKEPKDELLKNTSDNPYTVNYTFVPKKDEDK